MSADSHLVRGSSDTRSHCVVTGAGLGQGGWDWLEDSGIDPRMSIRTALHGGGAEETRRLLVGRVVEGGVRLRLKMRGKGTGSPALRTRSPP